MSLRSSRAVVILAFVLALIGGAAAGVLATRLSAPRISQAPGLVEQLQLNDTQRDQIKAIWEGVQTLAADSANEGQRLLQHRDDQISELLTTDQQRNRYAQINQEYQDRYSKLVSEREKAMRDAISRTRKLLTESQRKRYDAILAEKLGAGDGNRAARWIGAGPPDATHAAARVVQTNTAPGD